VQIGKVKKRMKRRPFPNQKKMTKLSPLKKTTRHLLKRTIRHLQKRREGTR
jgi:hypothetical protein